jgi:hypothetical protein
MRRVIDIPGEEVAEILLGDGWHQPLPGTLWGERAWIAIHPPHDEPVLGYEKFSVLSKGTTMNEDSEDCIGWEEEWDGVHTSVVIKANEIIGIRVRGLAVSRARVEDIRDRVRHFVEFLDTGAHRDHQLRLIRNDQESISALRARNPGISEDPIDTYRP